MSWTLSLEECGRAAIPDAVARDMAMGVPLLASVAGDVAKKWLPRLVAGEPNVVGVLGEITYARPPRYC
jgi:hypothetical protein